MLLPAVEGHRIWSRQYDAMPNPLLALEMRVLAVRLNPLDGIRFLDAGSGTGRWMIWASSNGARVFGFDLCREMILEAARKPALKGRLVVSDIRTIPVRDDAADLALCSFAMGYVASLREAFRELARVARRVVVSDIHPSALRRGWTRSFRAGDQVYELENYCHAEKDIEDAARDSGLSLAWRTEAFFGDPERRIFESAGKASAFDKVSRIPALLVNAWNRSSD